MKALDTIYHNLKAGKRYGYNVVNVRFPYFHTVLSYDGIGKYWCWCNFGSSANKATKEELQWIIQVIFELSPVEFINKFECVEG